MSFSFLLPFGFFDRRRALYLGAPGAVLLNRRAGKSGGEAPSGHMEASLKPTLPRAPRMGTLRKEPVGRGEESGAGLQPFLALWASVLGGRDRKALLPPREDLASQPGAALGDQRRDGRTAPSHLPAPERACPQPAQPAVQGGTMRMPWSHQRHGLLQTQLGQLRVGVRRAGRLDYGPGVALERSDLGRKDPKPPPAELAAAQGQRRLTVLDAAAPRPARPPFHPLRGVSQTTDSSAMRAGNLDANVFALDRRGTQGTITDGDGNGDRLLSGSPRGTGAPSPVPHFFQKSHTLPRQPTLCKALVHNPPLSRQLRYASHGTDR